jgi:metallophosphoesterase (TIGR00282 family)
LRILLLGDIVGRPGRKAVSAFLSGKPGFDLVVANGENAAGGFGLTCSTADELFEAGISVITSGNHIWKQKEIFPLLDTGGTRILRPANAAPGNPGTGICEFTADGVRIRILNLQGRTFMDGFWDCPFRTADRILSGGRADVTLVDFHCEATSEKQVMGRFLDGRVTAVAGTHTHVLTADACVLPGGTAYITDLGMCGSHAGIIGMAYDQARLRFLTGRPEKLTSAKGDERINGLELVLDEELSVESCRTIDERIQL